jgi:spore coat protein U-like protein
VNGSARKRLARCVHPGASILRRACFALAALLTCTEAAATADCSVSTTGVAFGTYDPLSAAPTDSTGNVTIVCSYVSGTTTRLVYSVSLSPGGSGRYSQRRMRAGAPVLNYNLFIDGARSTVWGDGDGGSGVATGSATVGPGVGNGRREDARTIYGRIPAQQDVLSGDYADAIVVTLEF